MYAVQEVQPAAFNAERRASPTTIVWLPVTIKPQAFVAVNVTVNKPEAPATNTACAVVPVPDVALENKPAGELVIAQLIPAAFGVPPTAVKVIALPATTG